MKNYRLPLSHAQLIAYLRRESDAPTRAIIAQLRRDEPGYRALFEVIDACQELFGAEPSPQAQFDRQRLHEIEETLLRFYAEPAATHAAEHILAALMASPVFYQRAFAKLEALAPQEVWEQAATLESSVLKSDTAIWEIVTQAAPSTSNIPQRIPSRARIWRDNFAADTQALARHARRAPKFVATSVAGIMHGMAVALDFITRRPAFAYAVPLLVFASVYFVNEHQQQEFWQNFVYDARVPYEYNSGTRGRTAEMPAEGVVAEFRRDFEIAMSDYTRRRYAATLQSLEKLVPMLPALQSQLPASEYVAVLRENIFFRGVSHLALARSEKTALPSAERLEHLQQAITFFAQADSLARSMQLPEPERDIYFLGLALGFAGRTNAAAEMLRKLSLSSTAYPHLARLRQQWPPAPERE